MQFQSHVPGCVDASPAIPKGEFTLEELLAHPWVKGWNDPPLEDFRYCWDDNQGRWSKAVLMAEWTEKGRKTWWVLGYMSEIPDLPKWTYPGEQCASDSEADK